MSSRAAVQAPVRLLTTMGDPCGIGPEICIEALESDRLPEDVTLTVVGSRRVLNAAAAELARGAPPELPEGPAARTGQAGLIDLDNFPPEMLSVHSATAEGGRACIEYIERAVDELLASRADALVTCPISKEAIAAAGSRHPGHTEMLGELTSTRRQVADVLLRVTPGVDPHTHRHIITGNIDSKFGIPLAQAEEAVTRAMALPGINPVGLHFHIGSQIFEDEPFVKSVATVIALAAEMKQKHGFEMKEIDVGGGYAVQYTLDSPAPPLYYYAAAITARLIDECEKRQLPLPRLIVEPGRSLVARAGVALYTAGVVKDIPGVRRYVSVDGGMADNIRPALYEARLEAVIANKMEAALGKKVTIAGKFCESGDILIHDIALPPVVAGDIIAVPGCGAYSIPESMNYNASFKPAVIQVSSGKARLIRRRETLDDLTRLDVV